MARSILYFAKSFFAAHKPTPSSTPPPGPAPRPSRLQRAPSGPGRDDLVALQLQHGVEIGGGKFRDGVQPQDLAQHFGNEPGAKGSARAIRRRRVRQDRDCPLEPPHGRPRRLGQEALGGRRIKKLGPLLEQLWDPWILLYVERWLKAPMQSGDGQLQVRDKGTPQGGVVSPILANLFLHYAFDLWVTRHLPGVRFARYADDAVLHCKSRRQAEYVLERIRERFQACNLELHPGKTRIVYCKDINRTEANPDIQFTFLGYTFRPRKAVDKYGRVFVDFSPAVSRDALKAMRQTIRGWRVR